MPVSIGVQVGFVGFFFGAMSLRGCPAVRKLSDCVTQPEPRLGYRPHHHVKRQADLAGTVCPR